MRDLLYRHFISFLVFVYRRVTEKGQRDIPSLSVSVSLFHIPVNEYLLSVC